MPSRAIEDYSEAIRLELQDAEAHLSRTAYISSGEDGLAKLDFELAEDFNSKE